MSFLDDAFDLGKDFVGHLGETLEDAGWFAGAPVATAVDLARAGFDKNITVGGSLLKGFQRGTQLFFGDPGDAATGQGPEENLLSTPLKKGLDGLEWVYDQAIAPAAALGAVEGQRIIANIKGIDDSKSPLDVFGGPKSAWAEVDDNRSSPGREAAYMWFGLFGDDRGLTDEGQKILDQNSKGFDVLSGTIDFGSRWFLDPTIIGGKFAKAFHGAKIVHDLGETDDVASMLSRSGGRGLTSSFGKRHDAAINFIVQPAKDGRVRTAPEIYAAFGGLQHATDGPAIAHVLENTVRDMRAAGHDTEAIKEQVRLISRAGMGDGIALKQIGQEASGAQDALAQLFTKRDEASRAVDAAVAARAPVPGFQRSANDLVNEVKGRGTDYYASDEYLKLTNARLAAVKSEVDAAEKEAARQVRIRDLFTGENSAEGVLRHQPLLASALGAKTSGLERRAGKEAGELSRLDYVFQSSLWNRGLKYTMPHIWLGQKAVKSFGVQVAPRSIVLQDERAPQALNNFLKHSPIDPNVRMKLVSDLAGAKTEGHKQTIIDQAIGLARDSKIAEFASKHPHFDDDTLKLVQNELTKDYAWERNRSALTANMFTAHKSVDPVTGETKRGDIRIDGDGQPTFVLDTQIANEIPLPDLHLLDHALRRQSNWITDMAAWVKGDRAPDPGRIQQLARDLYDHHFDTSSYHAGNVSRTLLNANEFGWRTEEFMKTGLAGLTNLWKFLQLGTRPAAYIMRNLTDSDMRAMAKIGPLAFMMHAAPRGVGIASLGGATRIKQHAAAKFDDDRIRQLETDIENFEDDWRSRHGADADITAPEYKAMVDEKKTRQARLNQYRTGGRQGRKDAYGLFGEPGQKSIETAAGEIMGAYGDEYGRLQRWKNSSTLSAGIYGDTQKQTYKNLVADQWRYVDTSDPVFHMESWLHAINKQFMQSKIGQQALKYRLAYRNPDEAASALVKWAQSSDEGKQLMGRLQWTWANKDQAAREVIGYLDHYVPGRALQTKLAEQEKLTQADLEAAFPDVELRPPVHGQALSFSLERGNHAAKMINDGMNRYMAFISDAPEDQLARHPLYAAVYEQEAKRQAERLIANPDVVDFTGADIKKLIQNKAHKKAQDTLKRYMFDVATRSDFSHAMRFMSPFIAAWEDTVRKWGRLGAEDPSILGRLYLTWNAPNAMGLVVDKDGHPVDRDKFTDADYMLLRAPSWVPGIGGKSLKFANSNLRIPKQSVNIIFQGGLQPGFGPLVAVPVGKLQTANPTMEGLARFVNPYGAPKSTFDALAPSVLKRAYESVNASSRAHMYDTERIYMAMLTDYRIDPAKYGHAPTWEEAASRAQHLSYIKILNNMNNPFPAIFDSPYKFYIDSYHDLQSREFAEKHERGWADDQFIKAYGDVFFPTVQSASLNNGGLSATAESVEQSKRLKSLIAKYGIDDSGAANPNLIRIIVGQAGEGVYNDSAHQWQETRQISPGSGINFRSVENSQAAAAKADAALGWYKFRQFMNTVDGLANERGLRTYADDQQLVDERKAFIANLEQENPAWSEDYRQMDEGKFDRDLRDLGQISQDSKVSGRDDMRAVRQYLALRQATIEQLNALGVSPGSKDAIPLKQEFTEAVQELVGNSTQFAEWIYHPFLERDPLLEPLNVAPVAGPAQAPTMSWGF